MSMPTAGAPQNLAQVPTALDNLGGVLAELDNEIDKLREHISPVLRPAEPAPGPSAPLQPPSLSGSDLANRVEEMARHASSMVSRLRGARIRVDL